jgi:hypothetical protein
MLFTLGLGLFIGGAICAIVPEWFPRGRGWDLLGTVMGRGGLLAACVGGALLLGSFLPPVK